MIAGEQCVAAGDGSIQKESRQVVVIGSRSVWADGDQLGEVGAEQQAAGGFVVVGVVIADEVAVDENRPCLAINQTEDEASFQSVDVQGVVFEIRLDELVRQALQVGRRA